jgi:hypothetical protein
VQAFRAAAARDDRALFLAAITAGALRRGVELIRHRGNPPQALLHDLTVVTRNPEDFGGTGAGLLNPFEAR